jgi:hypothetical protein
MKKCPSCNRTYADETLTFCLADGSLLSAPYDPEATQRIYPSRVTNQTPTEVLPSGRTDSQATKQSGNPTSAYVIIALIALIVGGGVMALLKSSTKDAPVNESAVPNPSVVSNTASPSPTNSSKPIAETKSPEVAPTKIPNEPKISGNDLSDTYGIVNGTIFNKKTHVVFATPQEFFRDSGKTSFANLIFDRSVRLPRDLYFVDGRKLTQQQIDGIENPK